MTLRKAIPEDADEIYDLWKKTWKATYTNHALNINEEDIEKRFERVSPLSIALGIETTQDIHNHWVIEEDEKIVACAIAGKEDGRHTVHSLYVDPDYQGKRYGKILMYHMLEWLGDDKEIEVEVVTYNDRAIEFYKAFAFAPTAIRKTCPFGDKEAPTAIMVRPPTTMLEQVTDYAERKGWETEGATT